MQDSLEQQLFFMRYAVALGEKSRLIAPPNPWVGCLIVKNGEILGEGSTQEPGGDHAEIVALNQAGILAKGATAYVTLEPCAHLGRTPPCTGALIKSGIAHVIIALEDPDQHVSGKGIATLKKAGIKVSVGIAQKEAEASLTPYLFHRKNKRPYTILKLASSLDGRTAAADQSSKWITSESARHNVHQLRAASCAIGVGSNTARLDQPQLTARNLDVAFYQPKKVLLDLCGKSPKEGADYDYIYTTNPDHSYAHAFIFAKETFFEHVLDHLGSENVISFLVEGGAATHAALLPFAQQLTIYYGNCLLGPKGLPSFPTLEIKSIDKAPRFTLESVARFENDVRLDYKMTERREPSPGI